MKKLFFIIFVIFAFAPLVTASVADENAFYKNLKRCEPYYYSLETVNENTASKTAVKIIGFEDKMCTVTFVTSSSSEETLADAADIEICKFPKKNLKKINKDNFINYKEKSCSGL